MSDKNDLSKIAATAPEHIWLDLGEEAHLVDDRTTFKDLAGVTWSEDNATGQGIKYVRALAPHPHWPFPALAATQPNAAPGDGQSAAPIGYTSPGAVKRLLEHEDDSLTVDAESCIGCDVPVYLAAPSIATAAREQEDKS